MEPNTVTLKSPEQRNQEKLRKSVDRLVDIKQTIDRLKQEQAALEGELLLQGQNDLRDTKFKTVSYSGSTGRASVTMAESLKLVYPSFLREVFGVAYGDAITEEIKYKVSAPAARMLTGLWQGNYTEMTVAQVIDQLPANEDTKAALRKKLKGANYSNDKKNLIAIGGFDEAEAESYAYFIAEAAVWESFQRLLEANGLDCAASEHMLNQIAGACIVEEAPKVTVEIREG